jgi:hypothetical protein
LVRDSIRKSCHEFFVNDRQLWMFVHICTTQEKHLSWICTCFL